MKLSCLTFTDSNCQSRLSLWLAVFAMLCSHECRAADPVLNLIGDRSFRVNGHSSNPVVVTDKTAMVADQYGEITEFELASGNTSSVGISVVSESEYLADTAHSSDGQFFAVAIGRRIEIRKCLDPQKVFKTIQLSNVSSDDYYYIPNAEIEFDKHENKLIAYDRVDSSLREFSIVTDQSRTILKGLAEKEDYKLSVSPSRDVWLASNREIICIKNGEAPNRFTSKEKSIVLSLVATESSVFVVYDVPSSKLVEASQRILMERATDTFVERNRWECDGDSIAIVQQRPVFRKSRSLCIGAVDGAIKDLARCRQDIRNLMLSTDGRRLVASLPGGICFWDTESWTTNIHFSSPYQDDRLFAVNNQGFLTAVTDCEIWQSNEKGQFSPRSQLPPDVSHVAVHRSLSANGEVFAYVDDNRNVHVVNLVDSQSIQLELPEHGRAQAVCVDETGRVIAVQYLQAISNVSQDKRESIGQEFLQGVAEGMQGARSNSKGKLNPVCIYRLPAREPFATGRIGTVAILSGPSSLHLSAEAGLFWNESYAIGNWKFQNDTEKPTSRRTGPQESMGFCTFNSKGDAICRKVGDYEQGVVAKLLWYGTSQRRPIELASEKKGSGRDEFSCVAAIAQDQTYVYLGECSRDQSTISKIKLPNKEVIWTLPSPSRVLELRLSPDNRYLGAKLGDSRYAILSVEHNND